MEFTKREELSMPFIARECRMLDRHYVSHGRKSLEEHQTSLLVEVKAAIGLSLLCPFFINVY